MSFLFSIIVAFAIGFSSAPANAPEQPVTAPVSSQIVEADPLLELDAETTLDDVNATKEFTDEKGNHYVATYVATDVSSDSMYGEFTYESIDFPGNFHHYKYSVLKFA